MKHEHVANICEVEPSSHLFCYSLFVFFSFAAIYLVCDVASVLSNYVQNYSACGIVIRYSTSPNVICTIRSMINTLHDDL